MSTSAKIIEGYTNHADEFIMEKIYYQHFDGYEENIIPKLKDNKNDLSEAGFEELEDFYDMGGVDYIYYIDNSTTNKVKCTVLKVDWDFNNLYGVNNYKIINELIL